MPSTNPCCQIAVDKWVASQPLSRDAALRSLVSRHGKESVDKSVWSVIASDAELPWRRVQAIREQVIRKFVPYEREVHRKK
jgi:hypothetical protein